jgi:WD40 repeat protein
VELARLAFSPDSKTLAVGNGGGIIQSWDLETGQPGRLLQKAAGLSPLKMYRAVTGLAFSHDGNFLVAGHGSLHQAQDDYDQVVRVWDLRTNDVLHTFPQRNSLNAVAFSPDGSRLLAAGAEKRLRIWKVADWQLEADWGAPGGISSAAFSPGGDLVAAGLANGTICVWQTGSDKPIWLLRQHAGVVTNVLFTPDGKTLVSAGKDRTVRLWHVATGRVLLTLRDHAVQVRSLVLTTDGNTIVAGGFGGKVFLWRAPSFDRIEALKAVRP